MNYEDIFSPETLEKLNSRSRENLQKMLKGKSLDQALVETTQLYRAISLAEREYISELEDLVEVIVRDLYPIVNQENIVIDARIGKPNQGFKSQDDDDEIELPAPPKIQKKRRRIINAITQGASVKGTFSFLIFKEYLDSIDKSLLENYKEIMELVFGIYNDPNAIAMMLAMVANNQNQKGGESDVEVDRVEDDEVITIKAWGSNFPMLLHETVKGLYELISLYGFTADKESNIAVVRDVDRLENEPEDLKMGPIIYDALSKLYNESPFNDPRVREYFFSEIFQQLDDEEFISFIENTINDKLTSSQRKWANDTMRDIADDLKADDADDSLLREYSQKVIDSLLEKWKEEKSYNERVARNLIDRFDKIKSNLKAKKDILPIPDRIRDKGSFADLTQYTFEELVKLIAVYGEKKSNIVKDSIRKFSGSLGGDAEAVNIVKSYIERFLNNKEDLSLRVDGNQQEVISLIPDKLLNLYLYLDPRNYSWEELENLLDSVYPTKGKSIVNSAQGGNKMVYKKNSLEIWLGDEKDHCIKYGAGADPEKDEEGNLKTKYNFCISTPGGGNLYRKYRYAESSLQTIYFVFDRSKSSDKDPSGNWEDIYHVAVIHKVHNPEDFKGKGYLVTFANNRTRYVEDWDEVLSLMDEDLKSKLNNLEDVFKPVPLSRQDRDDLIIGSTALTLSKFRELPVEDKLKYVQIKSPNSEIPDEILKVLKQVKIEESGKKSNLAIVAINNGHLIPHSILQDEPALARRYALKNFRTPAEDTIVPLPYVKYLDDKDKKTYYEKHKDTFLTFEFIDEFLGEEFLPDFVNFNLSKYQYLPKKAEKYVPSDKKDIFNILSKYYDKWYFSNNNNNIEDLANKRSQPGTKIIVLQSDFLLWKKLNNQEREFILNMIRSNNNNDEYTHFLAGAPLILKDGNKQYLFMPLEGIQGSNATAYEEFVLVDGDNAIKKFDSGKIRFTTPGGVNHRFTSGVIQPFTERIFNIDEFSYEGKPLLDNLNENVVSYVLTTPRETAERYVKTQPGIYDSERGKLLGILRKSFTDGISYKQKGYLTGKVNGLSFKEISVEPKNKPKPEPPKKQQDTPPKKGEEGTQGDLFSDN